jgi:hypothetical protein
VLCCVVGREMLTHCSVRVAGSRQLGGCATFEVQGRPLHHPAHPQEECLLLQGIT